MTISRAAINAKSDAVFMCDFIIVPNGWPGRAHEVGVAWVFYGYSKPFILNNSYFLYFCFGFWKQI